MADRACPKCQKTFNIPSRLRRHLARKTPCEEVVQTITSTSAEKYCCPACNRLFASRDIKNRHLREYCKASSNDKVNKLELDMGAIKQQLEKLTNQQQPEASKTIVVTGNVVTNIDNSRKVLNNTVLNSNNNNNIVHQQIANFLPPAPLPGWPAKWPLPLVDPKPFAAPSDVEAGELQQAAARLSVVETAACCKGEPRAVSALLMEVLRQAHENPEQRNIYLSPDRGDQALVFVPRQWLLKPLQEATHHIFEQVVKRLTDLPMQGKPLEHELVVGAKEGFEKKPQVVVQTSNSAMTAHLKNMEALLRVPGQQSQMLEEITWTAGDEPPQTFCREAFGHIKLDSTLYTMELDAGVNSINDVTEACYEEQARRAIHSLARQVLRWKAKNQTAVQITEKTALIYTYKGWEERPAAEVGEKLFRSFAKVAVSYVEGPVVTLLRPLGRYIDQNIDKLAASERTSLELLGQYSQQAERICATSTNPEFVKLKELMYAAKAQPQPPHEDILDVLGWT